MLCYLGAAGFSIYLLLIYYLIHSDSRSRRLTKDLVMLLTFVLTGPLFGLSYVFTPFYYGITGWCIATMEDDREYFLNFLKEPARRMKLRRTAFFAQKAMQQVTIFQNSSMTIKIAPHTTMRTLTPTEPLHTPVLLIIFNRPHTTQQVFDRISQVKPKKLYIAADGPRPHVPSDERKCAETRRIVAQVDWDCEVKTLFHDQNLRCGVAPATAISWLFENEETGIILEDDCVPSSSFFWYCQEVLERYRHDTRIMHVSGHNYLNGWRRDSDYSYYFSDKVNNWGWATWRRAWQLFDYNIPTYPELKEKGYLSGIFLNKFEEAYRLSKLEETYANIEKGDVWGYQWEFTVYSNSGLCVIPEVNLLCNIGFRADATHTFSVPDKKDLVQEQEIALPLRHPRFVLRDLESDSRNFNQLIRDKVSTKLKSLFNL